MTRLAIFTSHPIQYQAPWFRELAGISNLRSRVFFSYIPSSSEQGTGFQQAFRWDMPLLEGYDWCVLRTRRLPYPFPAYVQKLAQNLSTSLREFEPEVALVLGWHEISLIQALLACRRTDVPIILRGESNAKRSRRWYVSALHRRMFRQCASFLAIGSANADLYRRAGVSDDKIHLAPYFVDNERFVDESQRLRESRSELRRLWGIKDDAVCFSFVGKLEPKKRVLDFIRALEVARQKYPKLHGLIVGSGELMAISKSLVEALKLPITFTGFLNQSEIVRAYVAADAIVLPSDYGETWGLVVNEAMATGLPAIVSDRVGCAHDLVIEGETGSVVRFGEVSELAERMLTWASDTNLRSQLGQMAKRRVLDNFSCKAANKVLLTAVEQSKRQR